MMETPTEEILRAAQPETIYDKANRSIVIKRLSGKESSRIYRLAGPASSNEMWISNTLLRAAIRSVNNVPVPFPDSLEDMDELWETIDDTAFAAVVEWTKKKQAEGKATTLENAGESSAPQA